MSQRNEKLEALFEAALALESDVQRRAYLDAACPEPELRREVETLLEAHAKPDSVLASGPTVTLLGLSAEEQPGDRIGRYKLLQQVGEGGCGVVYMAEQEEPVRRRVALKVIKLGMDTKPIIARFEAERQALALMDHPNIARVFDAGTTGTGRPYFVMELVRGQKITEFCDENQLPTHQRLDLFMQVCQAVQHAHQKGIIHRDLKPSNVLVTVNDGVAVPKVIDFGIAKATNGQPLTDKTLFTAFEQFMGTPAYMSPEQAVMTSVDIDTRTDIYSLGVLLYELLTGKTPFDTKQLMEAGLDEMRRTIRERDPARPSTRLSTLVPGELTTTAKRRQTEPPKLVHQVRGDLDWIVMKCLEKDRARRYETANGLARDLDRHLKNEPVVARPPSKLYKFQKTVRRNKFGFAAGTAVILALVVGVLASTWQAIRATRAEREQKSLRQQAETKEGEARREKARAILAESVALDNVYAADMAMAKDALDHFQLKHARELLRNHIPKPGETDRRGLEWRYLSALARGEWMASIPTPLKGGLSAIGITPDDRFIAAADLQGGLCIIGFEDFKLRFSTNAFAVGGCSKLEISSDGRLIAVSGDGRNRSVGLWRLDGGGGLSLLRNLEVQSPYAIAISPDAKVLAVGTGTDYWAHGPGITRLFDIASGQELAALPESGGKAVGFSSDGKWLATAHWFGRDVKLWNPKTRSLVKELRLSGPLTLQFSADSQSLLVGTASGELKLHDLPEAGALTLQDETYDRGSIPKNSGFIRRGAQEAEQAAAQMLPKIYGYVRQAAISNDKRWDVLCCEQAIFLADRAAKKSRPLIGHEAPAQCVAISHDSEFMVSGDQAGTLLLWSLIGTDTRRARMSQSFTAACRGLPEPPSSPNGYKIAFRILNERGIGREIKVVDLATRRVAPILPTAAWPLAFLDDNTLLTIRGLAFLETFNRIAPEQERSETSPTLEFWSLASITNRSLPLEAVARREISALALSSDRRFIALAWRHGENTNGAVILTLATGDLRLSVSNIASRIQGLTFSPDGKSLVTACLNGQVSLISVESGSKEIEIGCEGKAEKASFTQDGKQMAVACWDALRLFSVPDGRLITTLTGGTFGAQYSCDGKTLMTQAQRWYHRPTGRQMFSTSWPWSVLAERIILLDGENAAAGLYSTREGVSDEWVALQLTPLSGAEDWSRAQPASLREARSIASGNRQ